MLQQITLQGQTIEISRFNVFIGNVTDIMEDCEGLKHLIYKDSWHDFKRWLLEKELLDGSEIDIEIINRVAFYLRQYRSNIFVVPNVDNSLNPFQSGYFAELLATVSYYCDLQMILTANNTGFIDGINLNDDKQRLFAVTRHRKFKRITIDNKPISSNGEPIKLSDAWMRGYLNAG